MVYKTDVSEKIKQWHNKEDMNQSNRQRINEEAQPPSDDYIKMCELGINDIIEGKIRTFDDAINDISSRKQGIRRGYGNLQRKI